MHFYFMKTFNFKTKIFNFQEKSSHLKLFQVVESVPK